MQKKQTHNKVSVIVKHKDEKAYNERTMQHKTSKKMIHITYS